MSIYLFESFSSCEKLLFNINVFINLTGKLVWKN